VQIGCEVFGCEAEHHAKGLCRQHYHREYDRSRDRVEKRRRERERANRIRRTNGATPKTRCAGCGCHFNEETKGCRTCYHRHWRRRDSVE
jgi:hypothetical protein